MEKIAIDPQNIDETLIKKAAKVIINGGIAAIPTETVYGLAGLADEGSSDKLYALKNRPKDKPFSLALGSVDQVISRHFDVMPPFAYRLIEKFWPGSLTVIYYDLKGDKIGVRVPAHIIAARILRQVGKAVYLPSANLSGEPEALSAAEVESAFNSQLDLIVDGGRCSEGKPSTVVDLTFKPFKVLRRGLVSQEDIGRIFIRKRIIFVCTGNSCRSPLAEYLLKKYLEETKPFFKERYEVISAGTSAFNGGRISSSVAEILKSKEGLETNDFYSRLLDRYTLLSSDLIFTMEDRQRKYILNFEPTTEGRVFNLKEFLPAERKQDIPDPVGQSMTVYNQVYALIKEAIIELKDWL